MQDATSRMTPAAAEFVAAVQAGRLDRADELLAELGGAQPLAVLRQITDLHIRRSRWAEAAEVADAFAADDVSGSLKRNLARNFAALRVHRPGVYRVLSSAPASDRYTIVTGMDGYPTLARRKTDNALESLSQNNSPRAALAGALKALEPTRAGQACLALCGIGDAYLLKALAADPPKLILGQEQGVYVIEPDLALLTAALMIHDCSGPTGPIEQTRFEWFVGREWKDEFREAILGDASHFFPSHIIGPAHIASTIESEICSVFTEAAGVDERLAQQVEAYYAAVRTEDLVRLMGDHPPRQPRILLLTTRFSTVLQYSSRDAADGFRQLGWDARVLIEEAAHHGHTPGSIRRAIAEFKPDVVFQIDHLRHEHGRLFPAALPFVCWVQDHLANLTEKSAGAAVTMRDYVLSAASAMYRDRYGYPQRQLIDMSKLTRIPHRPAQWESNGDDLTYVSNASQTPGDWAKAFLAKWPANSPVYNLMAEVCRRMTDVYSRGEILAGGYAIRQLVYACAEQMGMELRPGPALDKDVSTLLEGLNNLLFRQQALHWVADAADEMNLRFSLFGAGWEKHPRFAKYARGPVKYGDDLEKLTRDSKINLQIVPYFCLHQRLLDGIAAGGFFLVREYPADRAMMDLCNFLDKYAGAADTTTSVRAAIAPEQRENFERILKANDYFLDVGDPVEIVRGCMLSKMIVPQAQALPQLDEVGFASADGLRSRITRFIGDANLRADLAAAQRENIESRLSYAAGMSRVVERVRELLASESAVRTVAA